MKDELCYAEAVKRGCLRSSDDVGRSSGLISRQRIVKSFSEGLPNSGMGGGSEAWPIWKEREREEIIIGGFSILWSQFSVKKV